MRICSANCVQARERVSDRDVNAATSLACGEATLLFGDNAGTNSVTG